MYLFNLEIIHLVHKIILIIRDANANEINNILSSLMVESSQEIMSSNATLVRYVSLERPYSVVTSIKEKSAQYQFTLDLIKQCVIHKTKITLV